MPNYASQSFDSLHARDMLVWADTLRLETTCREAFELFSEHEDWPCLAVVDKHRHVAGLLDRLTLLSAFGKPLMRDLYTRRPVTLLMDKAPLTIEIDTPIDEITARIAQESPGALSTGFIIVENKQYRGIGTPMGLMTRAVEQAQRRNQALDEATRAAQLANEAKSVFLANMSHEMRTPLNGIIGNLELLGLTEVSREQGELLHSANVAAQTMLRIIGDVLDFSKIEAGKFEIEHIETPLDTLVEEVVSLFHSRARQKNLTIRSFIDPFLPKLVQTDPFRLRQVFMNLIGNAIKFTDQGIITVSTELITAQEGLAQVKFSVTDTGLGFDNAKKSHIFEAFSQEDGSTTRKFGGTGLGLTICKHIVDLLGGTIDCQSIQGQGSMFWFVIPFPVSNFVPEHLPSLNDMQLVVFSADHSDYRHFVALMEEQLAKVKRCYTPQELIAFSQKTEIDAIILDQKALDHLSVEIFTKFSTCDIVLLVEKEDLAMTLSAYRRGISFLLPVDSEPRFLSALLVNLARLRRKIPAPHHQKAHQKWKKIPAHLLADKSLLVVDDAMINRLVIQRQLEKIGLACDLAEDGQQALRMVQHKNYDLILTDCSMPVLDGFEFTRLLRQWERSQQQEKPTPVIAITALVMRGDAEKCFAAGMDDYLPKPVTLEGLTAIVEKWLSVSHKSSKHQDEPKKAKGQHANSSDIKTVDHSQQADTVQEATEPQSRAGSFETPVGHTIDVVQDHETDETRKEISQAIDLAALKDILGTDDPDFILEILNLFQESFDKLFANLLDKIDKDEISEVKDAAHAAKGAARNVAAQHLSQLLAQIEQNARSGEWQGVKDLIDQTDQAYQDVKEFCQDYARSTASAP